MDEMVASLRVAKRNDNGSPDPFVIERIKKSMGDPYCFHFKLL
jgi:hypothetical protein